MTDALKNRIVTALRAADRHSRTADDQREFRELIYLLTVVMPEDEKAKVAAGFAFDPVNTCGRTESVTEAHDSARAGSQATVAEAERAAYERVNAPGENS